MSSTHQVFVTVGTTKFEKLIEKMSSDTVLDILANLGYNQVHFQVGTGQFTVKQHPKLVLKYDRYMENFGDEINKSDLVISHAGAGSCLDVLRRTKPLLVIINEDLMDNHQIELARQLQENGYLRYSNIEGIIAVLRENNFSNFKSYPKPQSQLFGKYLDKCMGFV